MYEVKVLGEEKVHLVSHKEMVEWANKISEQTQSSQREPFRA